MYKVFSVSYEDVRLEFLQKRRFLISSHYVGVPCACEHCMFLRLSCSKCLLNMFNSLFSSLKLIFGDKAIISFRMF